MIDRIKERNKSEIKCPKDLDEQGIVSNVVDLVL